MKKDKPIKPVNPVKKAKPVKYAKEFKLEKPDNVKAVLTVNVMNARNCLKIKLKREVTLTQSV